MSWQKRRRKDLHEFGRVAEIAKMVTMLGMGQPLLDNRFEIVANSSEDLAWAMRAEMLSIEKMQGRHVARGIDSKKWTEPKCVDSR